MAVFESAARSGELVMDCSRAELRSATGLKDPESHSLIELRLLAGNWLWRTAFSACDLRDKLDVQLKRRSAWLRPSAPDLARLRFLCSLGLRLRRVPLRWLRQRLCRLRRR